MKDELRELILVTEHMKRDSLYKVRGRLLLDLHDILLSSYEGQFGPLHPTHTPEPEIIHEPEPEIIHEPSPLDVNLDLHGQEEGEGISD